MATVDTILDTSVLIAFLRRQPLGAEVRTILKSATGLVSAVSVFELFAGVRSGEQREQRRALIRLVRVVPIDSRIAERAGEVFTTLRRRGITIDNEDLLIAATALTLDVPVLTANMRHFSVIPNVRLVVPESS